MYLTENTRPGLYSTSTSHLMFTFCTDKDSLPRSRARQTYRGKKDDTTRDCHTMIMPVLCVRRRTERYRREHGPERLLDPACYPRQTLHKLNLRCCLCPYSGISCLPSVRHVSVCAFLAAPQITFSGVSSSAGNLTISPVILYMD